MDETFVPTHYVRGVPVIRTIRTGVTGKVSRLPVYLDVEGKQVHVGRGSRAVRVGDIPRIIEKEYVAPPPPPVDDLYDVEVAAAILKAVAWPTPSESCGYAETLSGHSATVIGRNERGETIVRICRTNKGGGRFDEVVVPSMIYFEHREDADARAEQERNHADSDEFGGNEGDPGGLDGDDDDDGDDTDGDFRGAEEDEEGAGGTDLGDDETDGDDPDGSDELVGARVN